MRPAARGGDEQNAVAAGDHQAAVAASGNQPGVTPMAQRVAVLGILNKRNGIVQNVALHPGQSVRWKDVIVRLRACETTAPWEEEKLTGAFVQVDVQRPDKAWQRVFSGWLYKESPSLNVVEHPVYDVWPKSCEMTYPAGPPAPGRAGDFEQPVEREEIGRRIGPEPSADAGSDAASRGAGAAERRREQRDVGFARHADRAERGQVVGHELAVEQGEIADLQARDEPGQRDLRGVGRAAEHAFAEEGAAELHAVEPADQRRRRCHTSIEWAWPAPCSASIACSSSALIQVSSRSAQAAMTPAKSRSWVTEKRPERSVRRSDRERWKRSSGMIARLRGSTQNNSVGVAAVGHRENAAGIALRATGADRADSSSANMRPAGTCQQSDNLAHHVLRAAQADAFVGLDQRAVDQDRVRDHRIEHLVVGDVGPGEARARRPAAPWRASPSRGVIPARS